jgi:methyl-accepting chemotaxis protein
LTVLGTTALAVALACIGFALHQMRDSRSELVSNADSLAEIIGYNAMLPLVAKDPGPVESTLLALTSNPAIVAAAVYAADRSLFARFARDYEGAPGIPPEAPDPGIRAHGDAFLVVRRIDAGGELVGTVLLRVSKDPLRRQLTATAWVAAGAFVLCLAPALVGTNRLRRHLAVPLAALAAGAERLSEGDFRARVEVDRGDEIGVLAEAFNGMAARLRGLIAEVGASARDVVEGTRTLDQACRRSREQASTQRASVDRTAVAIDRMEKSLQDVSGATDRLSESGAVTAASAHQVEASTSHVRESVDVLFEQIADTASGLSQSVESMRQVGENADHLDEAGARAGTSLERLAAWIRSVDDAASHGLALSRRTAEEAQRGHHSVAATMDAIGVVDARFGVLQSAIAALATHSKSIGDVVAAIDKIAAETNLLSLNASVVAAQAGQQGRAFSVVANEVGRLAERTSRSTQEIVALIRSIQHSTREAVQAVTEGSESVAVGVKLSREAGEVLSTIMQTAEESAKNVERIASASAEQTGAVGEVDSAFREVREGTQQIRRAVDEQSIATGRVHQAMQKSKDVAERVQGAAGEQEHAVAHITRTIQEICGVTDQVRTSMQAQSGDARQILHALVLFREIAGRNVEDAEAVQQVIDRLGERTGTLGRVLGDLRVEETEAQS